MTARNAEVWRRAPAVRFLMAGGANTAVTASLVVLLSLFLPGWLAFTISFALGLVFSVLVTGSWVFQSQLSPRRAATFAAAYVAIYLCGLALVRLLELWGAPPAANATTVLITAPLSFVAGRLIFANTDGKKVDR
jgi:putative flippase GtrA